jgi:L-2,4-diaminobutyrate decarboxylase
MVEEAYSFLLQEAYAPENFELYVDICAKKIAQYLTQNIQHASTTPVFATGLTPQKADSVFKDWLVQANSLNDTEQFASFIDLILQHSMHLHHPHYLGHQVAPPLPIAAVIDMLAALLNNSSVVFEMGPMEAVLEKYMIERFSAHIGWDSSSGNQPGGFFTSGGSLGNLSALLAARNKLMHETNAQSMEKMGVIVSEESHYSIIRSLRILGVSDAYIFKVPSAELSMDSLQESLYMARKKGIHIFATVISACSTATGTFDDIEEVAKFCQRENIWLHIDAAHGGAALLSKRLRPLLKGIEAADSIIIDAHKMMLMPALLTAVIFRDCKDPQRNCPENAHFLFDNDAMENDWYTLGRQTLECTKKMMVLKLFIAVRLYGEVFFAEYVERCCDLTQYFYELLQRSEHLMPLKRPGFNIICFKVKHANTSFQLRVRDALLQEGEFYIVSAKVAGETYLRCTIINPHTTEAVLDTLVQRIEQLADNFRDGSMTSAVPAVLCGM